MTESEVQRAAELLIASHDMRGFKLVFAEARRRPSNSREWAAVFDIFTADGALVDGPMIIVVDDATGIARFTR